MNNTEALIALTQGKKLCKKGVWGSHNYIYLCPNTNDIVWNKGSKITLSVADMFSGKSEWEEWKDPNETTFELLKYGESFILNDLKCIKLNEHGKYAVLEGIYRGYTGEAKTHIKVKRIEE